jgi:hypothetical protein
MELTMFIRNDFIDSVPIEQNLVTFPGNVGHFTRLLRKRNQSILLEEQNEPEFLLRGITVLKSSQIIRIDRNQPGIPKADGLKKPI